MEPSSAASAGRFKLVFVASFGLITGACALIGYYIVRRYRKSSDLNSTDCLSPDDKTPKDKEDIGESNNAEVISNEAAEGSRGYEEHEAKVNSSDLCPESNDVDPNQDSVTAESNKSNNSETGIERDAKRDVTSSNHTSNANDAQCISVDRPVAVNGDTLPGKRKVFSAGVTHFFDETNGDDDSSSPDSAKGTQQLQRQDSWSETVIVGSGNEVSSAKESETLLCQLHVNGPKADKTEEDVEVKEQRKPKANKKVTPHKEALRQKAQVLNLNDKDDFNLGTKDRQSDKNKINEVENFSGDQSEKCGKSLKSGVAAASSTQESTSRDVDKDQLVAGDVTPSTKTALPRPLTPPPDGGVSRRQRGGRGGQTAPATAPKQTRGAGGQNARSGRRRWSPLEDRKTTVENVELDASSQQVSWSSSRPSSGGGGGAQSGASSPWTGAAEEAIAPDPAAKVEFDDNFVDSAARKSLSTQAQERRSHPAGVARRSGGGGGSAKDIGSLVQAPPESVLERKPLISENEEEEEEEEEEDDEDGHLFDDHQRNKRTEEEETTVNVSAVQELSTSTAEERKKLVHIDENCVDSLIQLLTKEGSEDTAVHLASLRALVNLSWTTEKHGAYTPVIDRLFANVDGQDARLRFESLRVLANLSKNPEMVSYLLAAKAPACLLKMLSPDLDEEVLTLWLGVLDDVLWTSKELCLTYASLPSDRRAASPETVYTGLYGLKNSRILKSRIFILSRHRSQQVTYLASHIYSCLTS